MQGVFTKVSDAVDHVRTSLRRGRNEESKLANGLETSDQILGVSGMSGKKARHTLNNLMSLPGITYLEVGSNLGSTYCSSIAWNKEIGWAASVDNWSQFMETSDGHLNLNTRTQFHENVKVVVARTWHEDNTIGERKRYFCHDSDFREFDFSKHGPIDVYFFDGPHCENDQKDGITYAGEALADIAIIIVDDWNWGGPREGTMEAIEELGFNVHYQVEIFTPPPGFVFMDTKAQYYPNRFQGSDWHNGFSIIVVSRD